MICENHEDQLQEACRIARWWEEQAAQQSNAIIHSLASRIPDIQAVRAMGDIQRWNHAPVNAHLDLNDVVTVSHLV
jgi:hypothetical protein